MNEQNKKRVRAAVFLLLALGLADAAYRNGMELSWFHHGNPMPDNAGAFTPPAAADSSHVAAATPEGHGAPVAPLAMLPLARHKGAEGAAGSGNAPLQLASAAEDPNDILSGTGSLDSISPSAGVPGTPPALAGDSGGGAGDVSSSASGGDASTGGGSGSNAGSGGGGGGGGGAPIFGTSPTGGSTGGSGTGGTGGTGGSEIGRAHV